MSAIYPPPVNTDPGASGYGETPTAMPSVQPSPPIQHSGHSPISDHGASSTPFVHHLATLQDMQNLPVGAFFAFPETHTEGANGGMSMLGPEDIIAPWNFASNTTASIFHPALNISLETEAEVDNVDAPQIAWFGDIMSDTPVSNAPAVDAPAQQMQQILDDQVQPAGSAGQHDVQHTTSTAPIFSNPPPSSPTSEALSPLSSAAWGNVLDPEYEEFLDLNIAEEEDPLNLVDPAALPFLWTGPQLQLLHRAMQEGHLSADAFAEAHPSYAPFLSPEPLVGFIPGFFGFIIPYPAAAVNTDDPEGEDQNNLSLGDFLYSWAIVGVERISKKRRRGPNLSYVQELRKEKPKEVKRSSLRGQHCDIQGLDWKRLEISRGDAREMRAQTYRSYVNLTPPASHVRIAVNHVENGS
jgi:hypothetical protein